MPVVKRGTPYPTGKPVCSKYIKAASDNQETLGLVIYERSSMIRPLITYVNGANGLRPVREGEREESRHKPLNPEDSEFIHAVPPCRSGERRFIAGFGVDGNRRLTLWLRDTEENNRSWILLRDGSVILVENPSKLPDPAKIEEIREPIVHVTIFVPQEYVGAVITLATGKRGMQTNLAYHGRQVHLHYDLPLAEIVLDFFDKLKSVSRGYASMDYEFKEYRAADVVKVDMLLNGDRIDALSVIVHRSQSQYRGRQVASKMREIIPRQMYDVAIQAAIGANIISRENIKALRKNVLAKCYGGDITRKKKLLEKQKAGKKRMKQIGSVEVPQEAFLAILQVDD